MKLTIAIIFLVAVIFHLFLSGLAIMQALKFSYLSKRTTLLTAIYAGSVILIILLGTYLLASLKM